MIERSEVTKRFFSTSAQPKPETTTTKKPAGPTGSPATSSPKPPAKPAGCQIKCSGVTDLKKCRCIPCGDGFGALVAELKNATETINKSGQSTKEVSEKLALAQSNVDSLTKYCIDNEGKTDPKYISDQMSYCRSKVNTASVSVKAFASTLVWSPGCPGKGCRPGFTLRTTDCQCVCSLSCQTSVDEVYNFGNFKHYY
jgi:hypothetical protein